MFYISVSLHFMMVIFYKVGSSCNFITNERYSSLSVIELLRHRRVSLAFNSTIDNIFSVFNSGNSRIDISCRFGRIVFVLLHRERSWHLLRVTFESRIFMLRSCFWKYNRLFYFVTKLLRKFVFFGSINERSFVRTKLRFVCLYVLFFI